MFSSLDLHFLLLTFYEDLYVFAFRSSERMWKAVCLFVVVLLLYGFMGNKSGTFMSKPGFCCSYSAQGGAPQAMEVLRYPGAAAWGDQKE